MVNFSSLFRKPEKVVQQVYFSPGTDCLNAILEQIETARTSLKICVFTISDDRITQAILQAHRSHVAVKIITDNEKLFDMGSDIKQLAQAGIPIRVDNTANHMHHKFAIVDNGLVLTGSYNWTRSAAKYNHENLVITSAKSIVTDFGYEFDRLWEIMVPL
ncbi:endonuclease [Adhaeribacter arboris]|uniref:phospholipase D n=1 Tax=Adhaeribacter arboris TaxID=2072846 RepID=A0A2T2YHY9_9BACT|nr:phospholipase D-like domain-containing protein [Adhaeribacter arboris]PSR55112.1 endonuclease [Adhaeribacter arboris]